MPPNYTGNNLRTHGATNTLTWKRWRSMARRCNFPNQKSYSRYGGRGISICERWQSFENFLADIGECPSSAHTLERDDNDGNYEPGNCRWATRKEQNRNSSHNRTLTYQGTTLCVSEWSERLGINFRTIITRLNNGWSTEQTLGTPVKYQAPRRKGAKIQSSLGGSP